MPTEWRTALTIAGSDSGGGAGIQADLKTFADHGVHGMSAITAITAQNTRGVTRVDLVPVDGLRAQLDALAADLPIHAVKTGMLATAELASAVADWLETVDVPVVVDPVCVATSGARLLDEDALDVYRQRLLPRAIVSTPNLPEAREISGGDPEAWAAAANYAVLLKGGHGAEDEVVDTLYRPGHEPMRWTGARQSGSFHGTGCTLSSAIAARLALGDSLEQATGAGIQYVQRLVGSAARARFGSGVWVLPHGRVFQHEPI